MFGGRMTNQQRAEELLKVICKSEAHNTAWMLQEVLQHLRKQLSGTNKVDFTDELDVMFNAGWDECLKEIDAICDELELL
jgi:hypothetical protein